VSFFYLVLHTENNNGMLKDILWACSYTVSMSFTAFFTVSFFYLVFAQFLLNFCSVLTQFLQRYTVSMFLYCEQQWWKGTHFYCEVLLLSFCIEFCASVDSNGGKAHVVSYVYVVDMLSTNLYWKGTFCSFFVWIVTSTWKWVPVTPEMLIHFCFGEK
jgi:hypothetical protein